MITITSKENYLSIDFYPIKSEQLEFRIKKPDWWKSDSIVLVNNMKYIAEDKGSLIVNDKIIIKIKQNLEKINIVFK
jgi:hypothetical protein